MPIETFGYVDSLNSANPPTSDGLVGGDDHIRGIKAALKSTFPNLAGAVSATHTQLNSLLAWLTNGISSTLPITTTAALTALNLTVGHVNSSATVSANALSSSTLNTTGAASVGSLTSSGNVASSGNVSATGTVSGNVVAGATVVGALPAGALMDFAGSSVPSGWLACDGQSLSTTTFAQLFANIGYTWGGSGGSFNLPDFTTNSRFRRHRGALAGAVGNSQGPANLAHTHGVSGSTGTESADHSHGVNITSGGMSANATHSHTATNINGANVLSNAGGFSGYAAAGSGAVGLTQGFSIDAASTAHTHAVVGDTGGVSQAHSHNFNVTSGSSGDVNEARPYSATVLTCIKVYN